MKPDYTDITIILDRSGSMQVIKKDTIGGINAFIEGQKKAPGEATLSIIQFDDKYEDFLALSQIKDVAPLDETTYVPRGCTALLDAIGKTVNAKGEAYSKMAEADRPSRVVIVIQTDGQENASKEFTSAQIKEMVERQRKDFAWDFIYLGANQDAFSVADQMGILRRHAMTYAYDGKGTADSYVSASEVVCSARQNMGQAMPGFSAQDHQKQSR